MAGQGRRDGVHDLVRIQAASGSPSVAPERLVHNSRMRGLATALLLTTACLPWQEGAAASGPLGIDHRVAYDDSGIWARRDQLLVEKAVILAELGGALWLGGQDRLGQTYWHSVDASAFTALSTELLKHAFGRERPSQTDDPNQWSKGGQSFPSAEVGLQASFVTPFIAEYGNEHPWVWGLEALPAYDAVARVKTAATGRATCWQAGRSAPPGASIATGGRRPSSWASCPMASWSDCTRCSEATH